MKAGQFYPPTESKKDFLPTEEDWGWGRRVRKRRVRRRREDTRNKPCQAYFEA